MTLFVIHQLDLKEIHGSGSTRQAAPNTLQDDPRIAIFVE